MKTPITAQLQRVTASFASSEQPLSVEQHQEAIRLLRDIEVALQQISLSTDDPFMEAPIVPWHPSRGQHPTLFVDGMRAQAREQTETLLHMCLAYTPVSTRQDHAHLEQRRAITAAMRRLAQTLENIPPLARTVRSLSSPSRLSRLTAETQEKNAFMRPEPRTTSCAPPDGATQFERLEEAIDAYQYRYPKLSAAMQQHLQNWLRTNPGN